MRINQLLIYEGLNKKQEKQMKFCIYIEFELSYFSTLITHVIKAFRIVLHKFCKAVVILFRRLLYKEVVDGSMNFCISQEMLPTEMTFWSGKKMSRWSQDRETFSLIIGEFWLASFYV